MRKIFVFTISFFLIFTAAKAISKESNFTFNNRIFLDNIVSDEYQSTNRQNEFKNSEIRFDIISEFSYKKNWFGYFNYRIQEAPTQSSEDIRRLSTQNGGGDKSYENHFGLTRELYFGYENDDFKIYAGKFRPAFGKAWYIGRGIWTQELSVNYMQLEKLGVAGILKAGDIDTIGGYSLGLSAYTTDRKNLDNSQITNRDPISKQDGTVSDTRKLDSYTLHLDIDFDFNEQEKLSYRFAYTNLAVNSNQVKNRIAANKIKDQQGFSAFMKYQKPLSKNLTLDSVIEFADIKNVEGDADISDQYLNVNSIANFYKNWNVTLGFAKRKHLVQGENGYDQYFSEISAGYTFFDHLLFDKLQIQFGHKTNRINYKNDLDKRNSYSLMLRYIKWI